MGKRATSELQRGRAAYDARRWHEAAKLLETADRADPLAPDDLERLAWSFGLSGHSDRLLATGFRPTKTVRDAIREIVKVHRAGVLTNDERWHNLRWMRRCVGDVRGAA